MRGTVHVEPGSPGRRREMVRKAFARSVPERSALGRSYGPTGGRAEWLRPWGAPVSGDRIFAPLCPAPIVVLGMDPESGDFVAQRVPMNPQRPSRSAEVAGVGLKRGKDELSFELAPRLLQGHATANQLIDDEEQTPIQVLVGQGGISDGKGARNLGFRIPQPPKSTQGKEADFATPTPLLEGSRGDGGRSGNSPISRFPGECSRLSPLGGALAGDVHDSNRARLWPRTSRDRPSLNSNTHRRSRWPNESPTSSS